MVHTSLTRIFVFETLVFKSCGLGISGRSRRGLRRKENRSVFECDVIRVVRALLISKLHRKRQLHHISFLPAAVDADIRRCSLFDACAYVCSVNSDLKLSRGPSWMAESECEISILLNGDCGFLLIREFGLLRECKDLAIEF